MPVPAPVPPIDPTESLFSYLTRYVELLKDREAELGAYAGDGPSATQADAMVAKIRPIYEGADTTSLTVVWEAFRAAVDGEMLWLFAERDPVGAPITWALQRIQESLGALLENSGQFKHDDLDKYVSLALVAQAAQRQVKLKGNGINWRLALARGLYWLGGGRRK